LFDISEAVNKGFSVGKIKKGIEKCIVLCANCHAIRHFNMRSEKQTSPGIAGEFEELDRFFAVGTEEEDD
jgi:hypothetical protein